MSNFNCDYVSALESTRPSIDARYDLMIENSFVAPYDGEYFPSINPTDGSTVAMIAEASVNDVNKAVRAARRAAPDWARLSGFERGSILYRIGRLMQERQRELAVTESIDGGKIIREARDFDLPLAIQHFIYYAGWADKLKYALPGVSNPVPCGVVGAIIPWNFPLLMAAWKLAPALAAGNTVVLKPAEATSVSAMILAKLAIEAGLPPGVLNVVTGAGSTGRALVASDVDKIAFTGSTQVGKAIAQSARSRGIDVTLELGGKSANIVFDDAPIDQVVEKIIDAIFFNVGHVCCAGSRLIVQENIAEDLVNRLKRRMGMLRVGDPLDRNTDIGPINSSSQLEVINDLVQAGITEGVELYQPECVLPKQGFWYKPSLLLGVTQNMEIARKEIFGPVLSVLTFRTPAEAVELANNTEYGLAAGVWTSKQSKVYAIASELEAGVVWANTYNKFDAASPFGGYKESGYGREGGAFGLRQYLRERA